MSNHIFILYIQNKSNCLQVVSNALCDLVAATFHGSSHVTLLSLDVFQLVLAFQILKHPHALYYLLSDSFPCMSLSG